MANSLETEIERLRPPSGRMVLPWLMMLIGPSADIAAGRIGQPVLAAAGLAAFAGVYVAAILSAFRPSTRGGRVPMRLLGALALLTYGLSAAFGHNFTLLFVLLGLSFGVIARGRHFGKAMLLLSASAGYIAGRHGGGFWSGAGVAYGTFLSGMVTAALLTLHDVIGQLRSTREQLARNAVSQERLRFSRDLHDLLGHTLSVVVVKAEAVRRIAPRDLDAALTQAADIESVGRQALTEIREAVSGYRDGSLATELDRARSALGACGVEVAVRESGPPLPPQAEALMGWVVREGVTNVVRHSGATACEIELRTGGDRARLEITDNGDGSGAGGGSGTGLKGLAERLSMAGGSLVAGPAPRRGFRITAELPVETEDGQAA